MKNITIKTIHGHKCALVKATCHTDEGAMNFGFNYGDDTAAASMKIGRKDFYDTIDEIFPGQVKTIPNVLSCVEDEKWGMKHMPDMMESRPHCCFKVEFESLVIPEELMTEIEVKHGGNPECWDPEKQYETWEDTASLFKEAFGYDLPYLPHCGCVGKMEERWAKEHQAAR